MKSSSPVGQLAQYYAEQPVVQALTQLVPGGSSLDVLFKARATEIAEERAREFYNELTKDTSELTAELIQSEDFIHRYVITAKAAANTRRREKIRLFARLLKSSITDEKSITTDEYEEYLSILDELSYREISVLNLLEKFEKSHPLEEKDNGLQRASRFWEQFITDVEQLLNVEREEINALLTRLNRTGCYTTFTGGFFDYTGDKGRLTEMYFKIKKLLDV